MNYVDVSFLNAYLLIVSFYSGLQYFSRWGHRCLCVLVLLSKYISGVVVVLPRYNLLLLLLLHHCLGFIIRGTMKTQKAASVYQLSYPSIIYLFFLMYCWFQAVTKSMFKWKISDNSWWRFLVLVFVKPWQVWYEWGVTSPCLSPIHNSNGRSYWVGL